MPPTLSLGGWQPLMMERAAVEVIGSRTSHLIIDFGHLHSSSIQAKMNETIGGIPTHATGSLKRPDLGRIEGFPPAERITCPIRVGSILPWSRSRGLHGRAFSWTDRGLPLDASAVTDHVAWGLLLRFPSIWSRWTTATCPFSP